LFKVNPHRNPARPERQPFPPFFGIRQPGFAAGSIRATERNYTNVLKNVGIFGDASGAVEK
jgi:hypothetical protein